MTIKASVVEQLLQQPDGHSVFLRARQVATIKTELTNLIAQVERYQTVIKQVTLILYEGMEATGTGTLHYHKMSDVVKILEKEIK